MGHHVRAHKSGVPALPQLPCCRTTAVLSRPDPTVALPASPVSRRLGLPPSARGSTTTVSCPDIFELENGSFAIVGTDRTAEMSGELPEDAGVASYERIVVITRETLLAAAKDLQ